MEEIIEPQVHSLMMKNPNLTKSESLKMEKTMINSGTVRVTNILKNTDKNGKLNLSDLSSSTGKYLKNNLSEGRK